MVGMLGHRCCSRAARKVLEGYYGAGLPNLGAISQESRAAGDCMHAALASRIPTEDNVAVLAMALRASWPTTGVSASCVSSPVNAT
jgi:hypothetical protein